MKADQTNEVHEHKVLPSVAPSEAGYNLGIAGFIVSFFSGLVGLILSAIALNQSKAIGRRNTFAKAGLIIGIIRTALTFLFVAGAITLGIISSVACSQDSSRCANDDNAPYSQMLPDTHARTY